MKGTTLRGKAIFTLLPALTLFLILPSVLSAITCNEADLNTDFSVDILDLTMIAIIFGLSSSDIGFDPACDVNNDTTINVLDLALVSANIGCTVSCPDGDGDGYGFPAAPSCPNPEPDCNDTDPNINPGAPEVCTNGIDDNCDNESDHDSSDGLHGDSQCPVSVTGISLSDSSPREGASIYVSCGSSVPGINSIAAYIGALQCSYTSCAGKSANFTCLLPDSTTVNITLYYNFSGPCEDIDWDSVAAYIGALQCSYTTCAGKSANFTCILADGSDDLVNITLYYDFSGPCENVNWDSLVDSFGSQCLFSNWIGSAANFTCNVGPVGQKAAACYIYTSRSYQSGGNQFATMTVFPSACSTHSDQTSCGLDPDCKWCPECNSINQWSGGSDRCIGISDNCDYSCKAGECGATCDFDTTGCADTDCDYLDGCYSGTWRDYHDEPNYCQATTCTCTSNTCTSYTTVVTDNDNDGYDIECDNDCDDNNPNINPGATEVCNGVDDNCINGIDEGCDDDNDDYCDDTMTRASPYSCSGGGWCCPSGGGDCNDNNPNINPGAPEVCTNGIDDNCDNESDWDSQDGRHGDPQCPVSVTGISVSDTTPTQGNVITASCTSSVAGVNSVDALIESSTGPSIPSTELIQCSFTSWSGSTANFNCNVGSSTGQKTVKCYVDKSSSYQSGINQTATITVLPSSCSAYATAGSCGPDPNCEWCLECNGNQYSGGPDRCVDNGNCVYNCKAGDCGATCDFDTTGCADTDCDYLDGCYSGTWRDYHDEPNYCQATTCTCSFNPCSTYTPVVTDNDNDGYDIECDNDCDDNPSACGAACHPGATEVCDGYDNDCDTQIDEGGVCGPVTTCNSCSDCSSKIQSASSGDTIRLTTDITNQDGNCIEFNGADSVTFDGGGHMIDGDGDNDGYGIYLSSGSNNNIIRNCKEISDFYRGIRIYSSSNNIFENIILKNHVNIGIHIYAGGYNNLTNIVSTRNTHGVEVQNTDGNVLKNVTVSENSGSGIYHWYGRNTELIDIKAKHNLVDGITIALGSNNNVIRDSYIVDNGNKGVYITGWSGINPTGNRIYNNYLNNNMNVRFSTEYGWGTNYLNTARNCLEDNVMGCNCIGGNYWSNPTGTGFSDTCTNADADSFCDSSYSMNFDGHIETDSYPLTEPPGGCCAVPDRDGDGYNAEHCGGNDCDDDPGACGAACHPGATEICDGYDNDCDTQTDEGDVCRGMLVVKPEKYPTVISELSCAEDSSTNKIYCFGGQNRTGTDRPQTDLIVEYDSGTDTATSMTAKLPTIRDRPSCAQSSYNNRIYCFGGYWQAFTCTHWEPWGCTSGYVTPHYLDEIVEYDPVTDIISTKLTTLPAGDSISCAESSYNNRIYCFGGAGWGPTPSNQILEYNPATNTLTTKTATLPSARYGLSCTESSYNNRIYCFGGRDSGLLNQILEYDPATNTLTTKTTTLPSAKYYLSCVENSATHKIYCFHQPPNEVVEYEPATNTIVTMGAEFRYPRSGLSCAENSATHKIYCFGGMLDEIVQYWPP